MATFSPESDAFTTKWGGYFFLCIMGPFIFVLAMLDSCPDANELKPRVLDSYWFSAQRVNYKRHGSAIEKYTILLFDKGHRYYFEQHHWIKQMSCADLLALLRNNSSCKIWLKPADETSMNCGILALSVGDYTSDLDRAVKEVQSNRRVGLICGPLFILFGAFCVWYGKRKQLKLKFAESGGYTFASDIFEKDTASKRMSRLIRRL